MSDSWDDYAAEWDTNPDVIHYANLAFDSLCKYMDIADLAVLDFGCGTGSLTEKLSGKAATVVALDSSKKMIQVLEAKKIPRVNALVCDLAQESIDSQPLLQRKFDLIVASSVCAFVPDYLQTLSAFKALLKEGGTFIQWDWQRINPKDDFGFSAQDMERGYVQAGLEVERVGEGFSLTTAKGTMTVLMGIAKKTQ
ncbi:class I SAM-dependent DNA methyltransferase [Thalassotalea sp. PS06]|uniref:class I SAM-dependent DNA methyltransferase n=1 Tax=Thalassotalea sp. PS06 TaxID=2594005 RepID=UPI001162008D|nr:class I SAM-dependent methyltransferase [Thalassotalea sp. PS06]QDP01222.1 class I SAM-dependent methyltransferase [Thalassotalea sp. PS06]